MSKDLESAAKRQFQLIIENLGALVTRFEASLFYIESWEAGCRTAASEIEALDTTMFIPKLWLVIITGLLLMLMSLSSIVC